jgi:hypothetical protein
MPVDEPKAQQWHWALAPLGGAVWHQAWHTYAVTARTGSGCVRSRKYSKRVADARMLLAARARLHLIAVAGSDEAGPQQRTAPKALR